ncbi:hypothetical protein GOODEAATRI_003006, partial [Goodea atripinnis]
PVNFLDHTQHKGLAVAVFGVLLCKLWGLLVSPNPLPFNADSTNKRQNSLQWEDNTKCRHTFRCSHTGVVFVENWVILGVFYYPALYYPLLACGTLHNKVGYVLGSLLSWTHFSVLVWQKIDCPKTPLIYKYYSLFSSLPQITCLAFLSFQYPLLLFKGFKGAERTNPTEDLSSSYYRDYVKKVLYQKKPSKVKPFWLMILLAVVLQHITARFCFIKKTAGTRDLNNRFFTKLFVPLSQFLNGCMTFCMYSDLSYRGNLFLLTYLLFPVNVLIGVLLAVWRMIITALFNIVHMGRMDISLLNRNVEAFDPAYRCYAHYLKIEVSQSHPVMKAFCGMLLQSLDQENKAVHKSRDAEEGL